MEAQPEASIVKNDRPLILPASRAKAFVRSFSLLVPAAILGLISNFLIRNSVLTPNAVNSRLVDYAILALAMPIGLTGIAIGIRSLQWLSISLWPGSVGFELSAGGIQMKLGWLRAANYDVKRIQTAYLFELDENEIEEQFEAHLPEAHQRRHFLPRIMHPDAREHINRILLRQCNETESDLALTMQPLLNHWRQQA